MSLNNVLPVDATSNPDPTPEPAPGAGPRWKRLIARFGVAGFLFFFIKGLLWLIIPGVIALWAAR